jgi:hypothetical protein
MVGGRMKVDDGSWAPMALLSGGPAGMPGKPRPAVPKDFLTLELPAMLGKAAVGWDGTVVSPPVGPTSCPAGCGFGCG